MLSQIISARVDIEALLTVVLCVLAIYKGGGPEKAVAATFAGMWMLDKAIHALVRAIGKEWLVPTGHLAIDIAASAAFIWIALSANRVYPLWIAGLQLISTIAHLVRAIHPAISQSALAILMIAPSYLEILVFGLGIGNHLRRLRRGMLLRSWDTS